MSHKKEFIKNIFSFGSIDILGLLIPIITMPILTRALGSEQYGVYMLFITITYFGYTIIDYGTQYTAVRTLAKNRENQREVEHIFKETQGLRLFLYLVYSIIVLIYYIVFSNHSSNYILAFATLVYLLGYVLTPVWFYQGIGSVDSIMKISIISKLINLGVILFIVKSPADMYLVIVSLCVPMLFGGIFLSTLAYKRFHVGTPNFYFLKQSLYNGKDVFLGLLAPNLYNAIPTILLGTIYPPAEFANFAIASRLASVIVTIQNVIAKAAYPIIAIIKKNQVNRLLFLNFFISIIPIILIYTMGNWMLTFFLGPDFEDVSQYLFILCIGIVFIGLSNAISQGYFLPNGHDRLYRDISLKASLISGLIVMTLIYFYGLLGGAIAITLARLLFFIYFMGVYLRLKK